MSLKHEFYEVVERVEERFHRRYDHNEAGSPVYTNISLGYWVRLRSGTQIYVGEKSPPLVGGSTVKVTLEHIE